MPKKSVENETPETGSEKQTTKKKAKTGTDDACAAPEDKPQSPSLPEISEEEIRIAAYCRWEQRGGGDGCDIDDWVCAENDLRK